MTTSAALPTRRTVLATLLAAPLLAPAARANEPGEQLARDLLTMFDPATTASTRARFHASRISAAGQRRLPLADFEALARTLAAWSGGLDLLGSTPDGSRRWLDVRARRTGKTRSFMIRVEQDNPDRLFALQDFPFPNRYDGPKPAGPVSRDALRALIDRRLRFAVEHDDFSGAVQVAAPDGELVYSAAFGLADQARRIANTPATRFHIGSADKSFAAVIIARLVQQGRISWETRLAAVLPDYPNRDFAQVCTLRHLVTHSAGLGGLFDRPDYDREKPFDRIVDLLPIFASASPAFTPGTAAAYSNEGFVVLGAIAEAVTGRPWHDLLADWIYTPAGMTRSGHFRYADLPDGVATGYQFAADDRLGLGARQPSARPPGWRGHSAGGGYSTTADMISWLRAVRAGTVLPAAALAPMVTQATPGLRNYGMGFEVLPNGNRHIIGHGGGGPGSGIDGMSGIVWETGWTFSILGNYDAPSAHPIAEDIGSWLARQD